MEQSWDWPKLGKKCGSKSSHFLGSGIIVWQERNDCMRDFIFVFIFIFSRAATSKGLGKVDFPWLLYAQPLSKWTKRLIEQRKCSVCCLLKLHNTWQIEILVDNPHAYAISFHTILNTLCQIKICHLWP